KSVPTTTDPKKKLAKYEVVPDEAKVVLNVFERAAAGDGDLKIASALNKANIPGPRTTWSKETIRTMLRSATYKGLLVHGRTKSVDKGGDTHVRIHVSRDAWIQTRSAELEIVSPALWDRVQARKAKTRARYMRASDGTLMSEPESGLAAKSLLTGFLRCPCGSGMAHIRKNNRSRRYYCVERSRRGPAVCGNATGIPMSRMDDHVLVALNDALGDEDTAWSLCVERADRWRREHVRPTAEKAHSERQIKRLEAELANLNRQARRGVDIDVQEFNGTKAQIADLRAKRAGPGEVQFDREGLRVGLATVRQCHRGDV